MKLKSLSNNSRSAISLACACAIALSFNGCGSKFITAGDIAEVQVESDAINYELQSNSLMQQIMASGYNTGSSITFSKGTSDRIVTSWLGKSPFDIVLKASSNENGVVVKGTLTGKGSKELYIYPAKSSIDEMKKNLEGGALAFVEDNVKPGNIRLRAQSPFDSFVKDQAKRYDSNRGDDPATIYGFMTYLSSSAAILGVKVYFSYDNRLKVLSVSEDPVALTSSPYRSYGIKKKLDEQGIKHKIIGENSIIIDGGFSDWEKAYRLFESSDPYTGQSYVVAVDGNAFEVQEGYYSERPIRIEFIGWNEDGTRTYIFYNNERFHKIVTQSRVVKFKSGEKIYQVKFF